MTGTSPLPPKLAFLGLIMIGFAHQRCHIHTHITSLISSIIPSHEFHFVHLFICCCCSPNSHWSWQCQLKWNVCCSSPWFQHNKALALQTASSKNGNDTMTTAESSSTIIMTTKQRSSGVRHSAPHLWLTPPVRMMPCAGKRLLISFNYVFIFSSSFQFNNNKKKNTCAAHLNRRHERIFWMILVTQHWR